VTVLELESGKTATAQVQAVSNASVAINPTTATLSPGGTQTFTVTVSGTPDGSVTWSVDEGTTGGTVTTEGVYTAPAARGVYHVTAASRFDPSKKATATVTVQAGSLGITVQ
jgi:chitinase